jgi:hypothetical protein
MHGAGAQGQAADGAELLLELAGDAGVHGEVSGIVRARSELIDQQLAVTSNEKFDAKDAYDAKLIQNRSRHLDGAV